MMVKVGDRVRVVRRAVAADYYGVGAEGVVLSVSENVGLKVHFAAGTYRGDGIWWVDEEDVKVIGASSEFEADVDAALGAVRDMLVAKNAAYGDSALNPVRIFSKADVVEQLRIRVDDKLSRLARGSEYGDEDTVLDTLGYLVLLSVAEKRAK